MFSKDANRKQHFGRINVSRAKSTQNTIIDIRGLDPGNLEPNFSTFTPARMFSEREVDHKREACFEAERRENATIGIRGSDPRNLKIISASFTLVQHT